MAEISTEKERLTHMTRIRMSMTDMLQKVPKTAYGLFVSFKEISNPVIYVNEECEIMWVNESMTKLISECRGVNVDFDAILGKQLCDIIRGCPCRYIGSAIDNRECLAMQAIVSRQVVINKDGNIPSSCVSISEICYLPVFNGYDGCFIIYRMIK